MDIQLYSNKKQDINNTPERYIISGKCENNSKPFFIYINNIINKTETGIEIMIGKKYLAKVENNTFICELDILPTSLNFMFIQNVNDLKTIKSISDFSSKKWNTPNIISIKLCDTKYVSDENKKYMNFGL